MMTTVTTNKPFHIDKKRVYEAYKAVRSNRGAAGVDGQTLEQFDEDLGGNLYKIWNRMSSGSYFPPPVRAVSIPKKNGGGERILGKATNFLYLKVDPGIVAAPASQMALSSGGSNDRGFRITHNSNAFQSPS